MKLTLICLFIFNLLNFTASADSFQLPADWILSQKVSHGFLSTSETESTQDQLSDGVQRLIHFQENLLNQVQLVEEKSWYLQSIKTELAVGASGNIGILGAGGEAALEFIWLRNLSTINSSLEKLTSQQHLASQQQLASQNDSVDLKTNEIEEIRITEEMNPLDIKREIRPIVDFAFATGKIKRKKLLEKSLFKKALEFQKVAREINFAPELGSWYPYKFQLELGVSLEGHITPVLEVGNALRLRLEWYKIRKKNSPLMLQPQPDQLSKNARLVASVTEDLGVLGNLNFDNNFYLDFMKIGVGTSVSGNLVLVKTKSFANGALFFRRHRSSFFVSQGFTNVFLSRGETDYEISLNKRKTSTFSREQFRRSAHKAFNILSFFAGEAPAYDPSKKFNLNVIEAEFEFSASGGIGLVTVEGHGGVTLFATRNINI